MQKAQMLIGKWTDSATGETLGVENRAKRTLIAHVPRGAKQDVDRAVKAASDAFPSWSRMVPRERGTLLLKIAEAVETRVEELAHDRSGNRQRHSHSIATGGQEYR